MHRNTFSIARHGSALLAVLLLATVPTVRAQTGDDALLFAGQSPATGARMLGMAGAGGFAGIADYGAFLYNPAGLAFFDKSMFGGSLHTLSVTDEATYTGPSAGSTIENDLSNTGLLNLAYVFKVPTARGSLVAGAAYSQVNTYRRELVFQGENPNNSITDFFMPVPGEYKIDVLTNGDYDPVFYRDLSYIAYQTYAIDFVPSFFEDPNYTGVPFLPAVTAGTVQQDGRFTEGGSLRTLSFGGAMEAVQNVMLGLSFNASFGTYTFDRVFEEEDIYNDNDASGNTTDFDYLRFTESLESDLVGVNLRAGLATTFAPGLRAGLAIETPTFFTVNEDFRAGLRTYFDNGETYPLYDEDGEYQFTNEYEIQTPWKLAGGVSFSVADLMIGVDAEYMDWSQMELDASNDPAYFEDVNFEIRRGFDAVVNTKVGGEYRIGDLFLRAGWAYQPDPREDAGRDEVVDRSKTFLSAGAGYRFQEQMQIDFGWMQERFEDEYFPYSNLSPALGNTPVIAEDVMRNRFSIGLRMFF